MRKKIFIDINHPAHVHYFKNTILLLKDEGYEFFVSARDKDVTISLLKDLNIDFKNRGKGKNTLLGKFFYIFWADIKLLYWALKFRPNLFLSFGSPYAAHVSIFFKAKHIAFDDTEHAKLSHKLYRPFTHRIFSPKSYSGNIDKKQELFNGFMELAYLHPNYFKPNKDVLTKLNISTDEKFVILRFVAWNANHDVGHRGLSDSFKLRLVKELSVYAKVFITSEAPLSKALDSYRIKINPIELHHVLAFSSLLYGESATMASECAMLGVPSIFHDDVGRGYTNDLESEYGLVNNFSESMEDQEKGLNRAIRILKNYDKEFFLSKRNQLLEDKIDVTKFIIEKVKFYS
jgi:predicted glycosyltransferase